MADPNSEQEFIVQGEPVKSGQLADHLSREPGVKRIGQVAPDVVILSMTKSQADRLRSTFSTIVVEPNAPLKPFGAG
ncbi:hypothetical protein ACQR10_32445 [Bradyrhizobium sp. HKCCYLRH2060]|uniref:hypothetical protein n=1 Tax=Bradyrhizobium TaxID=374 RepID=UPI0028EDD3DB|nr:MULTISPECIES: hypothetical protein [unclassified Bradyrhizobium]